MSYEWCDVFQSRMAALCAREDHREDARAVLAPVIDGPEGVRVAVACLKLAGSDLLKLKECAKAALADYRDILAWAESPRQMRIGPSASAGEQASARRADAEEYARWLDGS